MPLADDMTMIEGKPVGERESERSLGSKEREKLREREQSAKERDEYNLPFTD